MEKKDRKPLIALLLVLTLGIVGGTFAYFTSTDVFPNVFSTKPYMMEVVETFESPDGWTPGTTTNKSVIATNRGDVDAAVRVSFTEEWMDAEGNVLSLTDEAGNVAAIINFNDSYPKWIKSTENGVDYYYYEVKLAKDESTNSFIESVTFNPDVAITTENDCVEDSVNHTKTCTTSTSGYAGGTYTLIIKVETVQYDQYKDAWSTNVEIFEEQEA